MTPIPMATYHWNISLSDTESIAMERALWLLINQEFPGKDDTLVQAARSILQRLPQDPVLVSNAPETG